MSAVHGRVAIGQAIRSVDSVREKMVEYGVSRVTFAIGVVNLIVKVFFIGRWPQHYWVYHTLKSVVLLSVRIRSLVLDDCRFFLLDFCWIANILQCLASLYTIADMLMPGTSMMSPEVETFYWYVFFMVASGPLGWAVVFTGNALSFHSVDDGAFLFIHLSPLLASWCLRWHSRQFAVAYPDLLELPLDDDDAAPPPAAPKQPAPWRLGMGGHKPAAAPHAVHAPTLFELLGPPLVCYAVWWLGYTAWLLLDGIHRHRKGDYVTYRAFDGQVKDVTGLTSIHKRVVVYMIVQAVLVSLALLSAAACYRSMAYHSVFIVAMVLSAVYQGASKYAYFLLDKYPEQVRRALQQLQ